MTAKKTPNIVKGRNYYADSRRLRGEALAAAESLTNRPLHFTIHNGITMDMEITKSDIKTILSKNTTDNRFNAIKNALARDIRGFLRKAKYLGWRDVIPGKHPETAYFVYFNRTLGANTYLCVRKMKRWNIYKPYAIIDQKTFNEEVGSLQKGQPPQ